MLKPVAVTNAVDPGDMSLGAALKARRQALGLSLREVTKDLDGISATTLCRIESSQRHLSHGPALAALAGRLQMSNEDLVDLAGGMVAEGVAELLGSDVRLAIRGGRLVPAARRALRGVHVAGLAERAAGAAIDRVAEDLDLDFRPSNEPPGFDDELVYRIPREDTEMVQRMWQAHGIAHVLLARDAQARPSCRSRDTQDKSEVEATALARRLLLPAAALHGAHRSLGAPEPHDAEELAGLVRSLAVELRAPAGWIVVRLAEEGLLGVAA